MGCGLFGSRGKGGSQTRRQRRSHLKDVTDDEDFIPEVKVINELGHEFEGTPSESAEPTPEPSPPVSPPTRHGKLAASTGAPSQYVIEPAPEAELVARVSQISNMIRAHVDAHYHRETVQANLGVLVQSLSNFGLARQSSVGSGEMIRLALEPRTRHFALRHILSRTLFKSIDVGARSRMSLLPGSVGPFLQAIPRRRADVDDEAIDAALVQWRTLSAFLLHEDDELAMSPDQTTKAMRRQAAAFVHGLNAYLYPFVTDAQAHADSLVAIAVEVAKLGRLVFAHPCEWHFSHWVDASATNDVQLAVTPGLSRMTDASGRRLSSPEQLVAPVIVRVR